MLVARQCLSLLIIYFVGDLVPRRSPSLTESALQVIRGLEFDWIVGAAAVVVALSVQAMSELLSSSMAGLHPCRATPVSGRRVKQPVLAEA